MISRRSFLSLALPAALILPELVLPKRSFFLAPRGGWGGDTLNHVNIGYNDALARYASDYDALAIGQANFAASRNDLLYFYSSESEWTQDGYRQIGPITYHHFSAA